MRAIGYQESRSAEDPLALVDIALPDPSPGPGDLLVRVEAIAVNPVDTKVRRRDAPADGSWRVLGWDAAGTVEAVGAAVTGFAPGDQVWYAGALNRPGCNSELQLVDARLVARRPANLAVEAAAALPLTAITAWELLFDRLRLSQGRRPIAVKCCWWWAARGVWARSWCSWPCSSRGRPWWPPPRGPRAVPGCRSWGCST
jgi:NADPH:quinone reductase-like Zn-dependent oxidoreductase